MANALKPNESRENSTFHFGYILLIVGCIILMGVVGYVAIEKNKNA